MTVGQGIRKGGHGCSWFSFLGASDSSSNQDKSRNIIYYNVSQDISRNIYIIYIII